MRATKMNEKFIDVISQLASEIEAADSTKKVDVAKAMNLIGDVMPRTLIGITYDLCRWMSWWRSEGRDAGHDLLGSGPAIFSIFAAAEPEAGHHHAILLFYQAHFDCSRSASPGRRILGHPSHSESSPRTQEVAASGWVPIWMGENSEVRCRGRF